MRNGNVVTGLRRGDPSLFDLTWDTVQPRLDTAAKAADGDGPPVPAPGDFSQTHVGDETDTSPYPVDHLLGISTRAYIRNMSELIRFGRGDVDR